MTHPPPHKSPKSRRHIGLPISILIHLSLIILAYCLFLLWPAPTPPESSQELTISLYPGESHSPADPSATAPPAKSSSPVTQDVLDQSLAAIEQQDAEEVAGVGAKSSPLILTDKDQEQLFTAGGSEAYDWRNAQGRTSGVKEHGGTPGSESSVELGLKWLIRHQDPDGKWSADSFDEHCRTEQCQGKGMAKYTPGVTGLAFMCFLAAGYTPGKGKYGKELLATKKYLLNSQNSSGFFGDEEMYSHAIILIALIEMYAQTRDLKIAGAIRHGISATISAQQTEGGWDYKPFPATPRNDTSITGWQLLSLFAARRLGFAVADEVIERGWQHIERFTLASGEVRYADIGPRSFRKSDALVSVGLLCALLYGKVGDIQKRQVQILTASPPLWKRAQTLDHSMYYWYHGTLALFLVGGAPWQKWNKELLSTLIAHQAKRGEEAGSWPPQCQWGSAGGRIYSTAINILNLEIYYRYRPSFMHTLTLEQLKYLRSED